ncbi:hypothetical protein BGY98DRAFT_967037 [Russula aff. rugulosa BPL654]|nr:hypothetical protein BGY98DRAFT_967037 [Russula aff. rugulosa BPL654]
MIHYGLNRFWSRPIPQRRTSIISPRVNLGQRKRQVSHEVGRLIYDERGEFTLRVTSIYTLITVACMKAKRLF